MSFRSKESLSESGIRFLRFCLRYTFVEQIPKDCRIRSICCLCTGAVNKDGNVGFGRILQFTAHSHRTALTSILFLITPSAIICDGDQSVPLVRRNKRQMLDHFFGCPPWQEDFNFSITRCHILLRHCARWVKQMGKAQNWVQCKALESATGSNSTRHGAGPWVHG